MFDLFSFELLVLGFFFLLSFQIPEFREDTNRVEEEKRERENMF